MDLKHVVVIDDDIDINNPMDVEWAIATRVQGDKDIVIVAGRAGQAARSGSLLQGAGVVPIGTKVGIDATIPDTFRRSTTSASPTPMPRPRRSTTTSSGKKDAAGKSGDATAVEALAKKILEAIDKEPLYYTDIAGALRGV